VTLSGVLLGGITSNSTATGAFGYADVTQGGDKIDLDWAVDTTTGKPFNLDWIRYVRVYNAVAKDLPPFGEISTEVTGIYNITDTTGSGNTTLTPVIRYAVGSQRLSNITTSNLDVVTKTIDSSNTSTTFKVDLASSATSLYINGVAATSGTTYTFSVPAPGKSRIIRFIAQNGTDKPYVTYLEVKKAQ